MLRQTPFLVVLVFGLGIGLGLAWKSGWIPVELGTANTGSLEDANSSESIPDDGTAMSAAPGELPPEDIEAPPTQTEPTAEVAEFPPRRLPEQVPATALPVSRPGRRISETNDEPEWAAEPKANSATRVQAANVPPRANDARQPTPIRLAAGNQDPPRGAREAADSPADSTFAEELAAIDEQISAQEFLSAHRALSKLYWNRKDVRSEVLPRLEKTARAIFFEPKPHLVEPYAVQANDQLRLVANNYNLSWEYLAKLNRTDPKRIQLGQKLKVLKGPFAAVVDLNEFALTVHLQGYYVKRYLVGIGKEDASPIGKFAVLNKIENPQYTGPDGKVISADDPSNPLGERWIDLGDSYGIHGTIEPESIGKAASRGCIRMREKDVIEVYDFLVKGSEVVIRK